ncbi:hypothetical protein MAR_007659 [Mya arenaria]|uniref:Uncharacterized protein n=1 Tax=Mya arenaria TaxID=6604 RepID=A0ABY7DWN1_MYAAR|nr:hypothetical protein MAR_007659 [Mya arenaria]
MKHDNTTASACNLVYRMNFYHTKTLKLYYCMVTVQWKNHTVCCGIPVDVLFGSQNEWIIRTERGQSLEFGVLRLLLARLPTMFFLDFVKPEQNPEEKGFIKDNVSPLQPLDAFFAPVRRKLNNEIAKRRGILMTHSGHYGENQGNQSLFEYNKVVKNPDLRSLAKLMLNSF